MGCQTSQSTYQLTSEEEERVKVVNKLLCKARNKHIKEIYEVAYKDGKFTYWLESNYQNDLRNHANRFHRSATKCIVKQGLSHVPKHHFMCEPSVGLTASAFAYGVKTYKRALRKKKKPESRHKNLHLPNPRSEDDEEEVISQMTGYGGWDFGTQGGWKEADNSSSIQPKRSRQQLSLASTTDDVDTSVATKQQQ